MDDAEEDPHFDKLEVIANDALKQVLGCKEHQAIWGKWASITPFGGRDCGFATETSDADY